MLENIHKDMIEALKAKETIKLATLRMLKGAIDLERINQRKELSDPDILGVIDKQIKSRKDSIVEFEKGNRADLIDKTNEEIDILSSYLPEPLTESELISLIEETITKLNASKISDMGLVMKELTPIVKGRADMSLVSGIIKDKLN